MTTDAARTAAIAASTELQAHDSVPRLGHLDDSHVEGLLTASEQARQVDEADRDVLHPTARHQVRDVAPDEVRPVVEAAAPGHSLGEPVGEVMDHPGALVVDEHL